MTTALVLIFILWIIYVVMKSFASTKEENSHPEDQTIQPPQPTIRTFRCPNCGAEARVNGDQWDCGFCGDCGRLTYK